METTQAIQVLETAGYQVRFDMKVGVYVVVIFVGCEVHMTRREVVLLAKDLQYVS